MRRSFTGTWKLESSSDPRFNMSGQGEVHLLQLPLEARRELRRLSEETGSPIPDDLLYSYIRDIPLFDMTMIFN